MVVPFDRVTTAFGSAVPMMVGVAVAMAPGRSVSVGSHGGFGVDDQRGRRGGAGAVAYRIAGNHRQAGIAIQEGSGRRDRVGARAIRHRRPDDHTTAQKRDRAPRLGSAGDGWGGVVRDGRQRIDGRRSGASVSTATVISPETGERLPAMSRACAVRSWSRPAEVSEVTAKAPVASARRGAEGRTAADDLNDAAGLGGPCDRRRRIVDRSRESGNHRGGRRERVEHHCQGRCRRGAAETGRRDGQRIGALGERADEWNAESTGRPGDADTSVPPGPSR